MVLLHQEPIYNDKVQYHHEPKENKYGSTTSRTTKLQGSLTPKT